MKHPLSIAAIIAGRFSSFASPPSRTLGGPDIILKNAPPAPKTEAEPAPRAGLVWSPGFWNYVGGWYVWEAGHWELERDNQLYLKPGWQKVIQGWQLQRGEWRVTSISFIKQGNAARAADDAPESQYDPLAAFR